jgi:hypothetical protein
MDKKGQVARNVVYFIVAFIVLIAVAIPITQQVVATAKFLSGLNKSTKKGNSDGHHSNSCNIHSSIPCTCRSNTCSYGFWRKDVSLCLES